MTFTSNQEESIDALGECRLIQSIKQWLGSVSPQEPYGIGDDCALINPAVGYKQIITTDAVTHGVHFDKTVSAEDAGAKLIKRNLSDIAAMGGSADHAVLALLCGSNTSFQWLEGFFKGIRNTCEDFEVELVGGDVSRVAKDQFSAVLTLVGHVDTVKLRTGAAIGDSIYVTGTLGGSITEKHYAFRPRILEGQWLASQSNCTSLMDLTDGLAKDLKSLLPSNSSAELDLDSVPISESAQLLSESSGRSSMEHAFCDGEDYELLFTVDSKAPTGDFEADWAEAFPNLPLRKIGVITASHGDIKAIYYDSKTNQALPWLRGFEHFGES
ncbi:MAG: thiamine-phosphate kinase [Opitutaceae bacterium]